jgi:HD-GYP domain-containing protein (c-di-GMP phosphodiesterase class II)
VQPIVDGIIREEYSIVGLTALKEHDEYTFVHCVNVSVLAIAVGHALELPRSALATLGVAGLLHDLGKLAIAPEVLHKPGKLDPEEWAQIVRHPLEGARMIACLPGLSTLTLDAMEVSLQHHMNVDGTGYPERPPGRRLGVLPRIVAAVDVFDAMTAHRAYRARPLTGYEALSILVGPERSHVDPAVLWALVRSVGPYPAGTVLLTASGRRMLCVSPNPQDPWKPFSRELVAPGDGDGARVSAVEEPSALDEAVERVIPPEEHGVNLEDVLAA